MTDSILGQLVKEWKETQALSAESRRAPLLDRMEELDQQKKNCAGCQGTCCTFVANSMQITPIQALDIYAYLRETKKWSEELIRLLKQTVRDYRLDYEIALRKGLNLRRTYTCPFFADGPYGCSLPKEIKPYGCLGFNPTRPGVTEGENCGSEKSYLERREILGEQEGEETLNARFNQIPGLEWKKLDIPRALLALDEVLSNHDINL